MSDIFISYSKEDEEIATRIAEDLRARKLSVFTDLKLDPGDDAATVLPREIKQAKLFLAILSPDYVRSSWARFELQLAAELETEGHLRIIPITVGHTKVPGFFQNRLILDLETNYEPGISRIQKALVKQPQPSEITRARRASRLWGFLSVLASLVAVASTVPAIFIISKETLLEPVILFSNYLIVFGLVVVLAGIVLIAGNWPKRGIKRIEVVTREVERTYLEALEKSRLNPLNVEEITDG